MAIINPNLRDEPDNSCNRNLAKWASNYSRINKTALSNDGREVNIPSTGLFYYVRKSRSESKTV